MIKFYCLLPGIEKIMPLVPAKAVDFKWVKQAREFYKTANHSKETTSCPGIFSLLNTGWIHRTYMDVTVETFGDGERVQTTTQMDQLRTPPQGKWIGEYVHFHTPQQLNGFREDVHNTLKTIIKIQTPWFVDIPKGYSLLMMPVPYNDDTRFTAAAGLLRGKNFLNVQLHWHCLNSTEVIKAGTPINQMVLIKDEPDDYQIEVVADAKAFLKENNASFVDVDNLPAPIV